MALRDETGPYFGSFGGRFVPESLVAALDELDAAYKAAAVDPEFQAELRALHATYTGRPSIITEVPRFAEHAGGARVILKREDLNHTGSHKINNVLGQALLARKLGKTRLIAETGAGQHGVATATAAALFGMSCVVYMGQVDTERQALNVARMRLLGAEVVSVTTGSRTLKDAINDAMRDWVASVDTTHYVLGTVAGPHPFPAMVRDFHKIIGEEAREQVLALTGALPDAVTACVGGGSNAMGIFHAFLDDPSVELWGYEAGGDGVETGRHAASITLGRIGNLQGTKSYLMQDEDGQTLESGRAHYEPVTDAEAMAAFKLLTQTEGILPAIETAHALAGTIKLGQRHPDWTILVSMSGRGDKDVATASRYFGVLDEEAQQL
jgi:tryptophan synthase beta chain